MMQRGVGLPVISGVRAGLLPVLRRSSARSGCGRDPQCLREGEVWRPDLRRFLREVETARKTIDVLWRYHAGDARKLPGVVPLEPASITIGELEVGEFTALSGTSELSASPRKAGTR